MKRSAPRRNPHDLRKFHTLSYQGCSVKMICEHSQNLTEINELCFSRDSFIQMNKLQSSCLWNSTCSGHCTLITSIRFHIERSEKTQQCVQSSPWKPKQAAQMAQQQSSQLSPSGCTTVRLSNLLPSYLQTLRFRALGDQRTAQHQPNHKSKFTNSVKKKKTQTQTKENV